jgi:16S rRNA (adenine1518-N6/adenine1519-N6)-dimethyltransferase
MNYPAQMAGYPFQISSKFGRASSLAAVNHALKNERYRQNEFMKTSDVKKVLKSKDFKPKKSLGQNFLVNKQIIDKSVDAANLSKKDFVLEIGAGLGSLTLVLAKKTDKVLAIEIDRTICNVLSDTLKDLNVKNVKVLNEDVLKIKDTAISKWPKGYKIVANLPYYIAAPIVRKFLETKNKPKVMVLLIQKEVAQRICSKPPRMNILAVSVQFYAGPEIISSVSRSSFWPQPNVESAIIKITPFKKDYDRKFAIKFFKIVKAGFKNPRKQLINNLSSGLKISKEITKVFLEKSGFSVKQRAETLSVENWKKLTKTIKIQ